MGICALTADLRLAVPGRCDQRKSPPPKVRGNDPNAGMKTRFLLVLFARMRARELDQIVGSALEPVRAQAFRPTWRGGVDSALGATEKLRGRPVIPFPALQHAGGCTRAEVAYGNDGLF